MLKCPFSLVGDCGDLFSILNVNTIDSYLVKIGQASKETFSYLKLQTNNFHGRFSVYLVLTAFTTHEI